MDVYEVLRLIQLQKSDRAIAGALDINRKTVGKYRTWATSQGLLAQRELPSREELHRRLAETWPGALPPQNISSVAPFRGVIAELREQGVRTGRKRIARLMREQGLRARRKRRFRTTTDSRHDLPIAPNVIARKFEAPAPNTTWVTDITYIWTHEGWLYLAVILDLFSRRIVGWSMSEQITRQIALNALAMALSRRQPPRGLIHHSDRGSQYASDEYRRLLAANGIVGSMSRRGNCWDNAVAESFFSTLKLELVHEHDWATRAEARAAIFEYLEVFYNGQRRHSSLDYVSPVAFERRYRQEARAA